MKVGEGETVEAGEEAGVEAERETGKDTAGTERWTEVTGSTIRESMVAV